MRRLLPCVLLLLAGTDAIGQAYGYKREEDPLVLGVKKAIGKARARDAEGLRGAIDGLRWQIDELKRDVEVDIEKAIEAAVASADPTRIAYALVHLVFQALRQKFYWNEKERLEKYVPARARLDAAQFYYEEILSHAVRRADSATGTDRHRTILGHLRELRGTLGSPGLFGVGNREPDLETFRRLASEVERLLLEVYPDFIGGDEDKGREEEGRSGDGERTGGEEG